jgi:hypothetical protein
MTSVTPQNGVLFFTLYSVYMNALNTPTSNKFLDSLTTSCQLYWFDSIVLGKTFGPRKLEVSN